MGEPYAAAVAAELLRRYRVPAVPDRLEPRVLRAELAGVTAADLVAQWGQEFGLQDLPPKRRRRRREL